MHSYVNEMKDSMMLFEITVDKNSFILIHVEIILRMFKTNAKELNKPPFFIFQIKLFSNWKIMNQSDER